MTDLGLFPSAWITVFVFVASQIIHLADSHYKSHPLDITVNLGAEGEINLQAKLDICTPGVSLGAASRTSATTQMTSW